MADCSKMGVRARGKRDHKELQQGENEREP